MTDFINPLVPELFLYLQSNRCPLFGDARHKWVKRRTRNGGIFYCCGFCNLITALLQIHAEYRSEEVLKIGQYIPHLEMCACHWLKSCHMTYTKSQ